ncbi:MAG: hypothetical protein N2422_04800 [Rhodobacteraceae bacterium]|nr:hypothetical protein [Paracoccaceae bacterium]
MEVFPDILERIDAGLDPAADPGALPGHDALLADAERVIEAWLAARGEAPEGGTVEGFRLLALHRQGCRGTPSFNACRETCREIVFRRNTADLYSDDAAEALAQRRLMAMTVKHLALFVGGKLAEAGLGDFCCSSRPLRAAGGT